MKIVIIDDDLGTRETMSTGLRKLGGHAVSTAATGGAGLAIADAALHEVVLVDLVLPDINGLEVMRALPQTKSACAAKFIMTGHASIRTAVEAVKLGAIDYLLKPVDIDDLLQVFRHHDEESMECDNARAIDSRIVEVLVLIADDPAIEVGELARAVELSESRLRHVFQEVIGVPIGRFQRDAKLDKAAHLLLQTYKRVSDVGYQTGFSDAGHFSESFRERFGRSPSRYRRLRKAASGRP